MTIPYFDYDHDSCLLGPCMNATCTHSSLSSACFDPCKLTHHSHSLFLLPVWSHPLSTSLSDSLDP